MLKLRPDLTPSKFLISDFQPCFFHFLAKTFLRIFRLMGRIESPLHTQLFFKGNSPISLKKRYPDQYPMGSSL